MPGLACIVLAAEEATDLNSKRPAALQPLCGKALIDHALAAVASLAPDRTVVVVPAGDDPLAAALQGRPVELAVRQHPGGDAEAVLCAAEVLGDFRGAVLVTRASVPLVTAATLRRMVETHRLSGAAATALTGPAGEQVGDICCFQTPRLLDELPKMAAAAAGHGLAEVVARLAVAGEAVASAQAEAAEELTRLCSRGDLARAEAILRDCARRRLLDAGVTLLDPATVYADEGVQVGRDTVVYPGVHLLGSSQVGEDCELWPYAQIRNSTLGNRVRVMQGAVVTDSVIGDDVFLGPYSHVRSGSQVGEGGLVGNFAEVARTKLGPGAKTCHFSFLGDTELGAGVNIGAGTITCNFDGANKHLTVIEEGAFIGSDAVLVAPVRIGRCAFVAAGSTITQDVPPESLAIARQRQVIKEGWRPPGADGGEH